MMLMRGRQPEGETEHVSDDDDHSDEDEGDCQGDTGAYDSNAEEETAK